LLVDDFLLILGIEEGKMGEYKILNFSVFQGAIGLSRKTA